MRYHGDFARYATDDRELHPDLAAYLWDSDSGMRFLKHPLMTELYTGMDGMLNDRYLDKLDGIKEAEKEGRYSLIISIIYARPYRLDALLKYADKLSDHEYWETAGDVWTDSENIWENREEWLDVLSSARPGREAFMSEEERAAFEALPETITIYRGTAYPDESGFSWTLNRATARWFADRFGHGGEVLTETIPRDAAFAFLTGRGEEEIVYFDTA